MFFTDGRLFHSLTNNLNLELPQQFTFPFYYDPHPLSILAANEVKEYLQNQKDFNHNFGIEPSYHQHIIGKMFGVLIVRNLLGELGYLVAFSGKLADCNFHNGFVPPVYNNLETDGFFKQGEAELNQMTKEIHQLEKKEEYIASVNKLKFETLQAENDIEALKEVIKTEKLKRRETRKTAKESLSNEDFIHLTHQLNKDSMHLNFQLKDLKDNWAARISESTAQVENYQNKIKALKKKRKQFSAVLQKQLHQQYRFLNANGVEKDLVDIFKEFQPPAGSGECAAPKLFQYAYQNNLEPICMAEFWWGASPKSEIKKHGQFYTSCRGKCEPILGHMLQGLNVESNPMLTNIAVDKKIEIVYEDEDLIIVNKPPELFSVPGKFITDSVQSRMLEQFPEAMLVHRLDMSTSGLLIVAKNRIAYHKMQQQFIKRTIEKKYVAVLDGILDNLPKKGTIKLPLRVDLLDRPKQLVCFEHGKPSITEYEVIAQENGKTRIHFKPITGRTHQLRVHAAHKDGLATAIFGDDLYGVKKDRLYLHAEEITFSHPRSKETLKIICKAPF